MSTRADSAFGTLGDRASGRPGSPRVLPRQSDPGPAEAGPGRATPVGAPSGGGRTDHSGSRVRHVVVDGAHPGVLVAWRRSAEGWTGDVAYVMDDRLIVEALPAARLAPLRSARPAQPGSGGPGPAAR